MGHLVPLPHRTAPVAAGWFVSGLLHAVLAIATLFFVQHLQLAPQTKPFQWDVAMVGSLLISANATPTVQSRTPAAPVVQQPSPAPKPVSSISSPIEPAMPKPKAPPTPASMPTSASDSYRDQLSHDETIESTPAPMPSVVSPHDVPPQHVSPTLSEQATFAHNESSGTADSQAAAESPLAPPSPTIASIPSADQVTSPKADYGLLAAIMAQWIEDLNKRYPAMLRSEGAQGKVTLAATLHEDGLLSDVRVVKSSGHAALDQVAVEDVENGPPIQLSHPLHRAQIPVKFSINYDLKTAR